MSITLPTDPTIAVHETRLTSAWRGADGIVRTRAKRGIKATLADAHREIELYHRLGQGKPVLLLVDMTAGGEAERAFRTHMVGPFAAAVLRAVAVLVGSPVSRVLGSYFLGLNKPADYPLKLFTDEAKALAWLRTFLG